MKPSDVPQGGGSFLNFGINTFKLNSFIFEDGQYGRQVKLFFTKDGKEKEIEKQTWYQLVNKVVTVADAWKFTNKLLQLKDVYAVVDDTQEGWDELYNNLPEFECDDLDSMVKCHEALATQVFEKVLGQEVNVVFHYDGEYLNIPSYKANNYQLAFGKNPIVYGGLNQTKAAPVQASAEPESGSTSGW